MTLLNVIDRYRNCTACPLHETAHEKVFFRGCVPCEVLFIGEAPGNDEDLYGEPFIGRAGKTLDSLILESSEETKPYTFGITNIVCCRPLDDNGSLRPPGKDEARECSTRLIETIESLSPKAVVLLGNTAKKYFKSPIPKSILSLPTLSVVHPAFINRRGGIGSLEYQKCLLQLIDFFEGVFDATENEAQETPRRPIGTGKKRAKKETA